VLRLLQAIRLLTAMGNPAPAPSDEAEVSADGIRLPADVYLPDRTPPLPSVLLCHGLLAEGRREIRMRQLAHALRTVGFAVIVPSFPDVERFRLTTRLRSEIVECARFTLRQSWADPRRFGIFGTSYAGTVGFLAAAAPEIRSQISWIASLGAYSSLKDVLAYGFGGTYSRTFTLQPDPYAREIFEKNLPGTPTSAHENPLLEELSINENLRLDPNIRILLCHSEWDNVVPHPEMDRLAFHFRANGNRVETFLFRKAPHARLTSWWRQIAYLQAASAICRLGH
jgi:dienelactone hydrolase